MSYQLKEIKIEVTRKCPLACLHCSSSSSINQNEEVEKDKCFSIISEAVELGIEKISFSGGEPLIWNYIVEAIQYCTENNIESVVYTCGNIDDPEMMFERLFSAGLHKAIFSIYSNDEKEHNQVTRKKDSFLRTLNSIKIANKFGIDTEIHFVALKKSFRKLEEVVKLADEYQVKTISVLRFVPQGRGRLLEVMSKDENLELKQIIEKLKEYNVEIRTGSPYNFLLVNENPKCMASRDRLIISPTLELYPCDAFKQVSSDKISGTNMFSSLKNDSLRDCWNNSHYFNLIRSAQEQKPKSSCKECNLYVECIGGCLAQEYIEYSTLNENPDPACLRL